MKSIQQKLIQAKNQKAKQEEIIAKLESEIKQIEKEIPEVNQ